MRPELSWYFCCLNPTERGVLRTTAEALVLTLYLGVPVDVWLTFWFGDPNDGEARRAAFLSVYLLEIASIIPSGSVDPVEVVRPVDLVYWVEVSLFILGPAAACLSGCEQSRVLPP